MVWRKLDGSDAATAEVGGKAATLDRLVAAGAPVPLAAALTVEAYRAFVDGAGLRPFLESLPADIEPTEIEDDAEQVDEAFLAPALPPPVDDAIHEAFTYVSCGRSVAVRSSATSEDLADASFAGQYRSLLGVGPDDLERSVRLCWASLWAPSVRAYRGAQGLDDVDPEMGVVMQQMVPAEQSGVVFTVDPTGDEPGLLRIEVVRGLGEHLVSGHVTPDVFHLERDDLSLREGRGPRLLFELGRTALAIEDALGDPQDIEWSATSGRLYILQSRPITAAGTTLDDGFDTPGTGDAEFTSEGVAEMLPGVLPPLLWTINAPLIEDAFTTLFADLGVEPRRSRASDATVPMVARFRGRPALNLSWLKAAARRMPGGSGAEVERQYLGRVISDHHEEPPTRLRDRLARIRPAWRAVRLRKRLVRDAETFQQAAKLAVALEPDYGTTPTESLVAYRHRLRDLARMGVRTELAIAASAVANYRALELGLERWFDRHEASLTAQRLTAGTVRYRSDDYDGVLSSWGLHRDDCREPAVAHAVYEGPVEETEGRLSSLGPDGHAFLSIVHERLRHSGSTAVYAGRTWEEERDALWSTLRQCRALDPDPEAESSEGPADRGAEPLRALEARLTRTWKWRMTRVLTGQVVDVRRRLLRRMVHDAVRFLHLREAVKAAVLLVGGEERRVIRELTARLHRDGMLERGDDGWFLSDDEIDDLAAGETVVSISAIARRRRVFETVLQAPPLPELFSGPPSMETETDTEPEGDVLHGWATSPGRVEGRARVVRDLADGLDLSRGEILVGRSSDPSWTPLFLTAGAVVMEQGGPLSHAAIVAREFGLPAVLNVKGATRRVETGMTIVVDGTAGSVEIVDDDHHDDDHHDDEETGV